LNRPNFHIYHFPTYKMPFIKKDFKIFHVFEPKLFWKHKFLDKDISISLIISKEPRRIEALVWSTNKKELEFNEFFVFVFPSFHLKQ